MIVLRSKWVLVDDKTHIKRPLPQGKGPGGKVWGTISPYLGKYDTSVFAENRKTSDREKQHVDSPDNKLAST